MSWNERGCLTAATIWKEEEGGRGERERERKKEREREKTVMTDGVKFNKSSKT